MDFLTEFLNFIRVRKKFILIPLFLTIILIGGLIVISHGTAVAPFVYTLF